MLSGAKHLWPLASGRWKAQKKSEILRFRMTTNEASVLAQKFCWRLLRIGLEFRMFKGALFLALGLIAGCFPVLAQQARHSGAAQHRAAGHAITPFEQSSTLSFYRANVVSGSNATLLFHNGPVRAWSDGAQLANETALARIGIAPLGLFPVTYLAPSDVGPVPTSKPGAVSNSRTQLVATPDGKDLPSEMISSPLKDVYYTGEVGFVYGRWSGKGNGDYWQNYVWGQVGNDKFQINAGASFENWSGNSPRIRAYQFSR
jgi:hypothetical protein